MKAYKGFNKNMTCRGFQYEEDKTYECEKAELCKEGFHACEDPLDCFNYYVPAESVFHEVEIEDNGERNGGDSKVVGTKIKIGAKLDVAKICKLHFDFTKERTTNEEQGGYWSALTGGDWSALTGGNRSALTGGNRSALTGGDRSALTGGNRSALTGGDRSALTGGDRSALTGGDWSALTGGDWSALTGGDRSALTGGDRSALTGGDWSALTGGNRSALTGGDWSVVYGGEGAKVRGGLHSVLAIQYWVDNEFKCIKFKEVDGIKIKENTYYKLDSKGRFREAKKND